MTDHDAFLRAIIENPADDGPRLVYADWLEEQGDPRGEFIRVQIELAKSFVRGVAHKGVNAHKFQLRRERELLIRTWTDWMPPVPMQALGWVCSNIDPKVGAPSIRFCRGFVEEIACRWEDWAGGECPKCRGRGEFEDAIPDTDIFDCLSCSGTGRTPGHADAILAATPLRKVRLTTRPGLISHDEPHNHCVSCRLEGGTKTAAIAYPHRAPEGAALEPVVARVIAELLHLEWPGIEFELPRAQPVFEARLTRTEIPDNGQELFVGLADADISR